MLTKAHQLDVVAKEFDYCFKTVKLVTGNLRGEFYKFSDGTPNVMLVLYNFKNINNLNLEKHFKFPTQLQKVLRSYPEIKKKIRERALKEDAIEQAEHLVKEWNRVKKVWINRYFYGNRHVLRDLIQLQNNQSQENLQELDNEVNNKESDEINEEKAKESKPNSHTNLLKRPAADNNHPVKLPDKKQMLEVQPLTGNGATNDLHDKLGEESAHQSENMEQEVRVDNNKHDRESVGALTTAANSDGIHNIQNEHLPREAKSYEKTGPTSTLGKIVIRKKCPLSKPEVLPKARQIQSIAKELGFVFDITWGENGKQRGEFYREKGKLDAMLVFYNFIRHGLLTLQKFYKFPSNHQKLLPSYPEVQRRVTSHALPQDVLEKGKDLDAAWNQIWKTWKKTYSPWGYDIITTAKQIIEDRSPFLRPGNIITYPDQNTTPTAKYQNKENEAPHHSIPNQFQNEEVHRIQGSAETSQMTKRETEKSTLAIAYAKNSMINETGNIQDSLTEVSMPKLISPLPPTPEVEVSCVEEESGQLYHPSQMIDEPGNIQDILTEMSMPMPISPLPHTPAVEVSCVEAQSSQLYCPSQLMNEPGNIQNILAEVNLPKHISPLPPTPEGEVSCFEEESGQFYFPSQNPNIATNSEMENVVLAFDLNML